MNNQTLKRILKLMKTYKLKLFISTLLAVAVVVSTLAVPIFIGQAIDTFIGKGNVLFDRLFTILLKISLSVIITGVSQWLMTAVNNSIVYSLVKDLRIKAFAKIHKLSILYIDKRQQGDIISRVVNDTDQFSEGLLLGFAQFFTGILTILITLIFMFILNPVIALAVMLLTPLSMIFAALIAKYSYKYFKSQSENRAALTSLTDEMIDGLSCVKNFGVEKKLEERFALLDKTLQVASIKALFSSSIAMPGTRFVNSVIYMSVGVMGAILVISGKMSVGSLSSFLSYASTYTKPFNEISGVVTELQNSIACAARIFEFIDEEELASDKENAVELQKVEGNIKLENVAFSYDKNRSFIENLNLDIKKGQKIAIVGPTGCGKTTLINLLMRFYEIDKGNISLDSKSIFDIKRHSLYSAYGMVFQDTWLKNTSIKENIAMAKPDASMEEIIEAAKTANAHGFIKRLPNSYDTVVSIGGENLSAGQRQIICIARIILLSPSILILDEATSSIDTRTELNISKAFDKLMENRSSVIVAHRLSTIKGADLILVMKQGKIIESGNHESLLKAGGFYSELYESM